MSAGRLRRRLEEVPPRRAARQPARPGAGAGQARAARRAGPHGARRARNSGRCGRVVRGRRRRGARHHRPERRRQVDDAEAADRRSCGRPGAGSRCDGRVGALIEVAAGFHPDLTGRENVFLQGAIMGMTRARDRAQVRRDRRLRRRPGLHRHAGQALLVGHERAARLRDRRAPRPGRADHRRGAERRRRRLPGEVRRPDARAARPRHPAGLRLAQPVGGGRSCARARSSIDRGAVQFDGRPAEAVAEFRQGAAATDRRRRRRARPTSRLRITGVQLLQADGEPSPLFTTGRPMTIRVGYRGARRRSTSRTSRSTSTASTASIAPASTRAWTTASLGTLEGRGFVDLAISKLCAAARLLHDLGRHPRRQGLCAARSAGTRAFPFSVVSDRRDFGFVYLEHRTGGASTQPAPRAAGQRPRPSPCRRSDDRDS